MLQKFSLLKSSSRFSLTLTDDAVPGNKLLRCPSVVLHDIQPYQRPRPAFSSSVYMFNLLSAPRGLVYSVIHILLHDIQPYQRPRPAFSSSVHMFSLLSAPGGLVYSVIRRFSLLSAPRALVYSVQV